MTQPADLKSALRIMERAWGRGASGYVFFPWIDREEQVRTGNRRAGYHEGPAFKWPLHRDKIAAHIAEHADHDVYWCPSVFEYPQRRVDYACDERALWADLDEVDPRELKDYPPTVAWETSPGRYQALWIIASGDIQGASWPGNENQRMTYMTGADPSGWDTTQLLRIPGQVNHKVDYRDSDGSPTGKILWTDGRTYLSDDFTELPEVQGALPQSMVEDVVADEISAVDRHEVVARVKLKLNHKARELLGAREVSGDRSEQLWYLMRCLADAGCTVPEIVSIVQPTPWNKFADRADELKRLVLEASKAVAKRSPERTEELEEERAARPAPERLSAVLIGVRPPEWLVRDVLAKGSVGFFAGQPKTFKSWLGLDLCVSVATGSDFLRHFPVVDPGPVLMIQEEDAAVTLKSRVAKVWNGKRIDKLSADGNDVWWEPGQGDGVELDPDIMAYVQKGFVVSEGPWQEWLDETLATQVDGEPYRLLLIDTLMMVAGDVEENRSQQMTGKIFRPLKLLARKHDVAVVLVHHMKKSDPSTPQRGGQLMLGSVANHAWSENSIYLRRGRQPGQIVLDLESKFMPETRHRLDIPPAGWEPAVSPWGREESAEPRRERRGREPQRSVAEKALDTARAGTTSEIAKAAGLTYQQAHRQLNRALEHHRVAKAGPTWHAKES